MGEHASSSPHDIPASSAYHAGRSRRVPRARTSPSGASKWASRLRHFVAASLLAFTVNGNPYFVRGDLEGMTAVFFDIMTALSLSCVLLGAVIEQPVVFQSAIPGLGISLLFGQVYLWYQSRRYAFTVGKPSTTQPFGVSLPGTYTIVRPLLLFHYFSSTVCN